MSDFTTPSFLLNRGTNANHERMRQIIPADIDLSEGSHGWNMTRPTALLAAEICEFILPEVIKLIFPEWSYGTFLNEHAKSRGMARRQATAATGQITVTGSPGTVIQAGSLFSTAAVNEESSVDYMTLAPVKIPDAGTVTIDIECTQAGAIGNASPDTIVLVSSRISGITSVTNEEYVSGGTEPETDESLIERITAYDLSQGDSFIGNIADYYRWARSVPGVGGVTVIPAQDDTGLVRIILTDSNGDPATEQLCASVYTYIMSPDSPLDRLAPINANISVEAPATMAISIKATVELADGATIETVKEAYVSKLSSYLAVAMDEGEIKYTRVAAALAAVESANDFSNLQIGIKSGESVTYSTSNIAISSSHLPTIDTDDLILTAGTV